MNALLRIVRMLMVAGGAVGLVASAWALLDPSILATAAVASPFDAPSPRWRAAFGLVFSLALLLFGLGVLRHRELP